MITPIKSYYDYFQYPITSYYDDLFVSDYQLLTNYLDFLTKSQTLLSWTLRDD